MFPTPAHDGVRLFLPTFFFLAAFAGWGTIWLADALARRFHFSSWYSRRILAGVVLGSAAFSLVRIHPYELSYYNELIGGPRGAWERGFELTYWYDAFTDKVIEDLNRELPAHAEVDYSEREDQYVRDRVSGTPDAGRACEATSSSLARINTISLSSGC